MATKKEKRAAGEARAEAHRADSIESGLQAQTGDREARQRQAARIKAIADEASKKAEQKLIHLRLLHALAPEFLNTGS